MSDDKQKGNGMLDLIKMIFKVSRVPFDEHFSQGGIHDDVAQGNNDNSSENYVIKQILRREHVR